MWKRITERAVAQENLMEALKEIIVADEATKHDQGKAQLSLISKESLEAEARAMAYGVGKYGRNNYKQGMSITRIIDALLRHTVALAHGEDTDPESGLHHADHIKACSGMLAYYIATGKGKDDR